MYLMRKMHFPSIGIGMAVILLLSAAILAFSPATASELQQEAGSTVTVTGYATQYVDDDELMFTDGTNTVKIEIVNGKASQIPLHTPVTITAQIKEQEGNKFEINLVSVQKSGEGAPAAVSVDLPVTTVAAIQAKPIDDQKVVLRGKITQQVSGDKYLFSDGTGMMVLEIENIPASAVPMNQPVDVFGEVDIDDGKVEVEVKGIQASPK